MILHIQPVTHLHTVAVNGQRLVVGGVVQHQGDQLLRELIGAIVVGAAGDVHRHAERLVIGPDDHVRGGLGSGVGAVGGQGRRLGEHARGAQRAVHLIGGYLQELDALPVVAAVLVIRCRRPAAPRRVQQRLGAQHIGGQEQLRLGDAAVNVTLRREIHHGVEVVLPEQIAHQRTVADVAAHEDVARLVLQIRQILQIARIGQGIQIHDTQLGVLVQHVVDKIGADEAGAAGHKDGFHLISSSAVLMRYWP